MVGLQFFATVKGLQSSQNNSAYLPNFQNEIAVSQHMQDSKHAGALLYMCYCISLQGICCLPAAIDWSSRIEHVGLGQSTHAPVGPLALVQQALPAENCMQSSVNLPEKQKQLI